jgi:hypothetical protein
MYKKIKKSNVFFIILFIILLIFIVVMRYLDNFLITENAPNGIISFELAKESNVVLEIIKSWNTTAKFAAGLSVGIDFLFLIVYATFLTLLFLRINKKLLEKTGKNLSWFILFLPFIAAFFDILENIAMINLLLGNIQLKWSLTAYYAAIIKFGLLLIAIAYIIVGGVLLVLERQKNQK